MPTEFIIHEDGSEECFDLGDAQCPVCGYPVGARFQNGCLVDTDPCPICNDKGD